MRWAWLLSVVFPLLPLAGLAAHSASGREIALCLLALPHVLGDLRRVNIDPRRREEIHARYGSI